MCRWQPGEPTDDYGLLIAAINELCPALVGETTDQTLRRTITELRTKNERLRAALTPIAEHWNWQVSEADGYGSTNYEWVGDSDEAFEIAAAALASTQ